MDVVGWILIFLIETCRAQQSVSTPISTLRSELGATKPCRYTISALIQSNFSNVLMFHHSLFFRYISIVTEPLLIMQLSIV